MPMIVAPALLVGIGARILLDKFNDTGGSFIKASLLMSTWQGVALHYSLTASWSSGVGIMVAFAIAIKTFIEFQLSPDVVRVVTVSLGVALGIICTEFLSQYFDRRPSSVATERKRRKPPVYLSTPRRRKHERSTLRHASADDTSVVTSAFTEHTLATNSFHISDITSVDSTSERPSVSWSMSPTDREVHVLRTRAALADSERRRLKEERKWAISQGNMARASQLKWEVKRFTALRETFNKEADLRTAEASSRSPSHKSRGSPHMPLLKPTTSAMKDRSRRESPPPLPRRPTYSKQPAPRGANG